jgi:hypothetical protein
VEIESPARRYKMWQLGCPDQPLTKTQQIRILSYEIGKNSRQETNCGMGLDHLFEIVIDRTQYLNNILTCNETLDAFMYLKMGRAVFRKVLPIFNTNALNYFRPYILIPDPGHIYESVH